MGHTDWGASNIVLLCLTCSLVHSRLDKGYVACGLTHQSVLRQLDLIHHQGSGIAARAFWTLLVKVCVEAIQPSLASCCLKLVLNYLLKLKSPPENPAYSCVFEPENIELFESSQLKISPLSTHMLPRQIQN